MLTELTEETGKNTYFHKDCKKKMAVTAVTSLVRSLSSTVEFSVFEV